MTHFLRDILRQPTELKRTLDYLGGPGLSVLNTAVAAVHGTRHVFLTGIGSSWHAALATAPLFYGSGHPVYLRDAPDMLEMGKIPEGSVVIVISRSGKSIEIVQLLAKARQNGATVIGVTNSAEGTLAKEAQIAITVPIELDYAISVNTYSTLALACGALASSVAGTFDTDLAASLVQALAAVGDALSDYQEQVANSAWLRPGSITYFLARGSSLGSCHEARLLWEEGVKSPATAMGTSSFRHGPQEMIAEGARFGMWTNGQKMRAQDFGVARDLRKLGAQVMFIGQDAPPDAGDLVFSLPAIPAEWQFLIDILPVQLVAERLSRLSGVDCDTFRLCSYIVEDEYGLLGEGSGAGEAAGGSKSRKENS